MFYICRVCHHLLIWLPSLLFLWGQRLERRAATIRVCLFAYWLMFLASHCLKRTRICVSFYHNYYFIFFKLGSGVFKFSRSTETASKLEMTSLPTVKVIVLLPLRFHVSAVASYLALSQGNPLPFQPLLHLPSEAQRWAPCGILEETSNCMKFSLVTLEITKCGQQLKAIIGRSDIVEPHTET